MTPPKYPGNTEATLREIRHLVETFVAPFNRDTAKDRINELAAQLQKVPELEEQVAGLMESLAHCESPTDDTIEMRKRAETAEREVAAWRKENELLVSEAEKNAFKRDELKARVKELEEKLRIHELASGPDHACQKLAAQLVAAEAKAVELERERDEAIEGELERADERDTAKARVTKLEEAALAFEELNVCYRLGKRPSEKLFARLEKARLALPEKAQPLSKTQERTLALQKEQK